jgi:very-short-patch-repair endonuclease
MPRRLRVDALLTALDAPATVASRSALIGRFGRRTLEAALQSSEVTRILPGFYAHSEHARGFATRVAAADAWLPADAAIGGMAACVLHGIADAPPARLRVATRSPTHPRVPEWIWLRRSTAFVKVERCGGLRTVSVADALIQAWEEAGPRVGSGLVVDALRDRRVASPAIADALRGYPRVRRRTSLVRLLGELSGGIDSYLELLASRTVLHAADLRDLVRQAEVVALGRRRRLDAYDPVTKTAIEFDGRRYHSSDDARRSDLDRDSALASIGIVTLRFTYEDVVGRPRWCRDRIRRTIRARRAQFGLPESTVGT